MAEEEAVMDTQQETNVEDLTMSKNGGVLKEIITPGTTDESPSDGCKVYVHYTGRLLDGTKFDSSVDRNEKFSFNLGQGQVIKAWDLGVASMKRGEKCRLTCQPDFAYGDKGSPPTIPPNATLVFEIELFDWEHEDVSEDGDKGILRQIIKKGQYHDTPNEGASVDVHIKGIHDGKTFDERDLKFNIGEDDLENFPSGVEKVIKRMKKGELSRFQVKSNYAFGAKGNEALGVPAGADVTYEIELRSFEKVKESWEMSDEEKVEQSEIVKAKGTEYFKAGNYQKATVQYKKIVQYLNRPNDDDAEEKSELKKNWNALLLAGRLNLALCYIKTKKYEKACQSCDEALNMDKNSEKAYFRRGEAQFAQTNYEEAKSDFLQAKNLNPENKLAAKKINECNTHIRKQREKEKKTFAGMFERFARQDEQKEEIRKKQAAKAKKTKEEEQSENAEGCGDGEPVPQSEESEMEPAVQEEAAENGVTVNGN